MQGLRRCLVGVLVACALVGSAYAAFYDFEQITIDATANGKGFTASKITPNGQPLMTFAQCRLRTAEISYSWADPSKITVSSTVGTLLEVGEFLTFVSREEMTNFRAIRTGAVSGQLDCTYKAVQ